MQKGTRVQLRHDVERYPHFIAPAGATGTVVDIGDDDIFAVRMDEKVEGAEDWDNEIHWYPQNGDEPDMDLVAIERAGAPAPQRVPRKYLDARFDVTGWSDEQIATLQGYVAAQAETNRKQDDEVTYPDADVEFELNEVELDLTETF